MTDSKGFTLIETLLYIGLFAIVIGGGMVAVYQIIQSTDANNNLVIVQEEANFLLRKINWALTGATAITTPTALLKYSDATLQITKNATEYIFDLSSGNLTLKQGVAGTALSLNSANVIVSLTAGKHLFQRTIVSGHPDAITAAFTLTSALAGSNNTENFSTTKYLRK